MRSLWRDLTMYLVLIEADRVGFAMAFKLDPRVVVAVFGPFLPLPFNCMLLLRSSNDFKLLLLEFIWD